MLDNYKTPKMALVNYENYRISDCTDTAACYQ